MTVENRLPIGQAVVVITGLSAAAWAAFTLIGLAFLRLLS